MGSGRERRRIVRNNGGWRQVVHVWRWTRRAKYFSAGPGLPKRRKQAARLVSQARPRRGPQKPWPSFPWFLHVNPRLANHCPGAALPDLAPQGLPGPRISLSSVACFSKLFLTSMDVGAGHVHVGSKVSMTTETLEFGVKSSPDGCQPPGQWDPSRAMQCAASWSRLGRRERCKGQPTDSACSVQPL